MFLPYEIKIDKTREKKYLTILKHLNFKTKFILGSVHRRYSSRILFL